MTKVALLLAPGFEEIEALTVVDVLRRAAITCEMLGFEQTVTGSHGINVQADALWKGVWKDMTWLYCLEACQDLLIFETISD